MRAIDRVRATQSIIDSIADTMNFDDVSVFFEAMNIDPELDNEGYPTGGTIREVIRSYTNHCSNAALIDIADQLDLGLSISSAAMAQLGESKYWLADHLRVFISHVNTMKASAGALKQSLQKYGISCFVAHEDIEVSEEWRDEILRCLISMDALVAILTEDFNTSNWTDQEVGVAVSRDVLIIPINKGVQPYGFIEKYQSLNSEGSTVKAISERIFQTIAANQRTKQPMAGCLAKLISTGSDIKTALFRMRQLHSIEGIGDHHWTTIRNNIQAHPTMNNSKELVDVLNETLSGRDIEPVILGGEKPRRSLDEEIPF